MTKIKAMYVGDAESPIEAFGVTFEEGKSAEVDAKYATKIENNPFFKLGSTPRKTTDDENGLKAEHHGGGKFNITRGETVLASGLSKADADAFNALSAEEQAEYVKAKA